jgi:exodeoxyribonuclease VII large subunit
MALPPENAKIFTIGEISRAVKGLLEDAFAQGVWVSGEVSNLARPASGHIYLTLKDSEGQLRGVMWRSVASRIKFALQDGMEVIARGKITVYVPRGDYQLQIEELQPKGVGALELAFRQLREKLFKLNYFDAARKKPLPRFPRRAALVTSPSGAAVRDMLEILGRRWPALEVWVCPVRVQGEGAAEEIAAAIRLVNRVAPSDSCPIDVMIVGRGGGSMEDLWAFNEECVAQAIFASRVPVVSGVGHETDLTIADLVADVRALTPSEAAERVAPDRREILDGLAGQAEAMRQLLMRRLDLARARLDDLSRRRSFRLPLERLRDLNQRLDEWSERLNRVGGQRLLQARRRVEAVAGRLHALSPLNVLARGYSLTRRDADQSVVRNAEQVAVGERLVTLVQRGRIISRVEELFGDAP